MNKILRFFEWRETHENYGLDFIRIFLGAALFIRGYLFMSDQTLLQEFIGQRGLLVAGFVIHFVTLAHLYGGFIMTFGLMTRLSALVQIPVLMGAVYLHHSSLQTTMVYLHLTEGLLAQGQSLELSVLVLFLLLVIYFYGPGRLSLDYYFFKWNPAAVPAPDPEVREHDRLERSHLIEEARARAERTHAVPHAADVAVLEAPRVTPPAPVPDEVSGHRLKLGIKYAGIFLFAFILLASLILMDVTPIFQRGLEMEELAVLVAVVLFIFGLFYFFYRNAFANTRDDE